MVGRAKKTLLYLISLLGFPIQNGQDQVAPTKCQIML